MILPVHITLFLLCITPIDSIRLTTACHTAYVYETTIYCAPFTGNSIFVIGDRGRMQPITFTDNVNYRIYDIAVTPFSCYLNNGRSIEKYYFGSGIRETVFTANNITSFLVTRNDEILLSDRQKREIIFLDFTYAPRFIMEDVSAKDMFYGDTIMYLLLQDRILHCDEFGNIVDETSLSIAAHRIFVYDTTIIVFSPGDEHIFAITDSVRRIELQHGVGDIAEHGNHIVVLDNHGTTLFIYRKSDF